MTEKMAEEIMDKTPANGVTGGINIFDPFGIMRLNALMFNAGMRVMNPFWPR